MKNILFHLVAWVSLFIQIILSFYHMSNYCIISEQSYLKRFWRNLTKLKQKPGHIFRRLRVVVFWGWLGIMWNQIGSGCTNVCFFPPVETVQQWALECNRSRLKPRLCYLFAMWPLASYFLSLWLNSLIYQNKEIHNNDDDDRSYDLLRFNKCQALNQVT